MKKIVRLLQLLPVYLHRLTGRLPIQPKVQFANIGEGAYDTGVRSYFPDASAIQGGQQFLLYKRSSSAPTGYNVADCCTPITATTDIPLGSSDDAVGTSDTPGVGIAVNLFGAVRGTVRVVTDGTIADGDLVMPKGATLTTYRGSTVTAYNGAVTKWVSSGYNVCIGRAVISSDATSVAGEIITIVPMQPHVIPAQSS